MAPDGLTAVTLLTGAAEFCTAKGCQRLNRRCDFLIARRDGSITRPKGVVRNLGLDKRGDQVFPFLSGQTGLPRGFKSDSSCAGLSAGVTNGGNGALDDRGNGAPASPARDENDNPD